MDAFRAHSTALNAAVPRSLVAILPFSSALRRGVRRLEIFIFYRFNLPSATAAIGDC